MIDRLKTLLQHRQSSSVAVAAAVAAGLWYLGDAGVTGQAPQWVLVAAAFAVAVLFNEITDGS